MQLQEIAKNLANLDLENKERFCEIVDQLLKDHPMERGVFILRGEIVQSQGVKPRHVMQLLLQLEVEYTHKMILQQKYCEKMEVVRGTGTPEAWQRRILKCQSI